MIHPNLKEQEEIFAKMAKALKLSYEIKNESPYKDEFVEMVKEAEVEFNLGKGKR